MLVTLMFTAISAAALAFFAKLLISVERELKQTQHPAQYRLQARPRRQRGVVLRMPAPVEAVPQRRLGIL